MLKLRPSSQLTRQQVKGIVNLVAHSIQGLKPENITVIDNTGQVLNDSADNAAFAGAGTLTQIEMTKKVQDELQKNVQTLLEQVLGPGKAAARVSVELDFDQRTIDRQIFEPVVDDKGIIRSSQELSENYKGASQAPGGPAGTTANIPGYVTNNNNNAQSNYEKKEVTRNYEINETKEKVISTPGSIKRLTVAVLVDGEISRAQQDSISRTVASAIGMNQARGDVISVESMAFSTEMADKQRREEEALQKQQAQSLWLKVGIVVVIVLVLLYFLRMYMARRRQREEDLELQQALSQTRAEVNMPKKKELSPQEKEQAEQREAVEKLAKSKPEDVAQLIRAWLADE